MEFGDEFTKLAYILNGPAIFVVFIFGGFFNIVTICILQWRKGTDNFNQHISEALPISLEKENCSANPRYGSVVSDEIGLISKKQNLNPFLFWITCSEQILLTSALLNFSLPTIFNLFSTYYANFIPLWYVLTNTNLLATAWLLIISLAIYPNLTNETVPNKHLRLVTCLFVISIIFSLPKYFEVSVEYYPEEDEYMVEPTVLTQSFVYNFVYKIIGNLIFSTAVPYGLVLFLFLRFLLNKNLASLSESNVLLALSIKFLVCRLPTLFLDVSEHVVGQDAFFGSSLFMLAIHVSNFLIVLSCTMNFFIFVLFSSQFRSALNSLFRN